MARRGKTLVAMVLTGVVAAEGMGCTEHFPELPTALQEADAADATETDASAPGDAATETDASTPGDAATETDASAPGDAATETDARAPVTDATLPSEAETSAPIADATLPSEAEASAAIADAKVPLADGPATAEASPGDATYTMPPPLCGLVTAVSITPASSVQTNDFAAAFSGGGACGRGDVQLVCVTATAGSATYATAPICMNGACLPPARTFFEDEDAGPVAPAGSLPVDGTMTDPATGVVFVAATGCWLDGGYITPTVVAYVLQAAAPTMQSPAPGGLAGGGDAAAPTMASATLRANIRFTTDGTTPTCARGTLLIDATGQATNSAPVTITQSTTFEAIACKAGYLPSAVSTFVYTISVGDAAPADGGIAETGE